ncbi:AmmeMemoRadiSam system protein B [Maricurvus nonylphenolicus]|uniref:AmmeMemoRadiSam system protein B n=1 Tax=Maricurvus nonylphenolicus TaxID=1008307 RepID=UPI0036F20935
MASQQIPPRAHLRIRPSAVAGSFYPADPQQLHRDIKTYLDNAGRSGPFKTWAPKALITPHAGYVYSAPIAASAFRTLKHREDIHRVVLLGPSHRVPFKGIASPDCDSFRTPLGIIPLDTQVLEQLEHLNLVQPLADAHRLEHSLEVQLPFLQTLLDDFELIPLVVGDAEPETVAEVLDMLWGGDETLIIISSDLSHYLEYSNAKSTDRRTTQAIESFDHHLNGEQACGCRAINGLLCCAHAKRMQLTTLDVRNSGDTAGDKDRVVGYGAYALH